MKKLFILSLWLFVAGISNAQTQVTPQDTTLPDMILVRVVETLSLSGGPNGQSEMIIYYGPGKSETIELNNVTARGYPISNMEKIYIVLDRLKSQRYNLVANYNSGGGQSLIFRREIKLSN